MRFHRLLSPAPVLALTLSPCVLPRLAAADDIEPPAPSFNAAYMDPTVDPRVDFGRYAAGRWYQTTEIPADKAMWGSFNQLDERNRFLIRRVLEDAAAHPGEAGSLAQKVGDFYATAMDTAAIEAAGLKPVAADLARVDAVASVDDLFKVIAALHSRLVPPPFNPSGAFVAPSLPLFSRGVQPDDKRSDTYILILSQGGLGLPSRDYYFDPRFEKHRAAYLDHMAKLLMRTGESAEAARAHAATAFALERALAEISKTPVELRDPIANYHKMTVDTLAAASPGFPVKTYLAAINYPAQAREIIVRQPDFFAAVGRMLQQRPLDDWKVYLRWRVVSDAAPYLSAALADESFRFNGTVLNGVPVMEPRWQRMARLLDAEIGQAVGRLYVDRYFPPEVRARLAALVANVEASMKAHLEQVDWMSAPTRAKALAKFARFRALIGYPPKWRDYSALTLHRDGFFENLDRAGRFEVQRQLGLIGRKVDRDEFGLPPQVVNAYFQSTANQIVFLAGILQPPFFDPALDDAVNYGGIGVVIGHEITHGFDDRGRLYDADGNLADWWTEADAAQFKARAQKVVDEYNQFEALPGLKVNGELTLGENIADLGGVTIAYDAFERSLAGKPPPPKIDGLTAEQRFFLAFAQLWRTQFRDDALRRQVMSNPHSPGQFRAFGPLVNLPEFYAAFGIKEGDPMWRSPEQRAKIW
ncbi:MAG TPA: M13 family metallopeptidase [Opitutaceae bacterium]|nr:M13 family metallopeptidase [Opitutaceae bacterium]